MLDLATHGIDESTVTIKVVQFATKLCNRMTPRLEIGGPQIGTPELAAEHEKKKAQAKAEAAGQPKEKKVKEPKAPKQEVEVDAYGNRKGTQASQLNDLIFSQPAKKPVTIDFIAKKTGLSKGRISGHMRYLVINKHVTKVSDGYKIHPKHEANGDTKPEAAPEAKPVEEKKDTKKGTKKAPAKKVVKKSTKKVAKKKTKAK
jgi:hypothetical protein